MSFPRRHFSIDRSFNGGAIGQKLALPAVIEDGRVPVNVDRFVYILSALVLAALVWGATAQIREFARAPGQIVPAGSLMLVSHLEGGTVENVPVREGDVVDKGAVLVQLRPIAAASDLDQLMVRKANLQMQARWLDALTSGSGVRLTDLPAKYPGLAKTQLARFNFERAALANERETLSAQIAQREAEIGSLQRELESANRQIQIQREQLSIRERLLEKGYGSRWNFLEMSSRLEAATGNGLSLEGRLAAAKQQLAEAQSRLQETDARAKSKYAEERLKIAGEMAELDETIAKFRDRVDLLTVRSPAHGIIQELGKKAAGDVVKPGEPVAKIVPLDGPLVADVRLDPKNVGQVHVGDDAELRISTFDPNVYGFIEGKVERISPTTFQGENRELYFKATIKLDRNYVDASNRKLMILPGMVVEADIVTGAKSLIKYLLKPVYRSLGVAFSEH